MIGELRSSVTAHFTVENSTAEVTYVLEKDQPLVRVELKVDWKEIGKDIIPVLTWQTPLSYQTDAFRYDVPAAALSAEVSTTMFPDCVMAWRFAWTAAPQSSFPTANTAIADRRRA